MSLTSPLVQTLLGTLFTWGMTTIGALGCVVHYLNIESMKLLDCSLGFSAGVMLAASYWSLLLPASEMAEASGYGRWSFIPLLVGVVLGAVFVLLADFLVPIEDFSESLTNSKSKSKRKNDVEKCQVDSVPINNEISTVRQRRAADNGVQINGEDLNVPEVRSENKSSSKGVVSRRLLLMMIAITVHNIPEGMAVGVGYGAAASSSSASSKAHGLALAIGLQNLPEGLAVSLPLHAAGMGLGRAVWYGQLSGAVEPVAGLLGCLAVRAVEPLLPYSLAFAAGAMIFVVLHDIVPEYQRRTNGNLASIFAMGGFVLMMCLDMGLG